MLESLKKMIKDTEEFAAKLNALNERLAILVQKQQEDLQIQNERLRIAERELNDAIFDLMRKSEKRTYPKQIGQIPCAFDSMSEADKMKPMGLVCFCPKCSAYSISDGSEHMKLLGERFREAFKQTQVTTRSGTVLHLEINRED